MPRKKMIPTDQQRADVRRLAARGLELKHICTRLNINIKSVNTLRYHFHPDITMGRIAARIRAYSADYKEATSRRNLPATIRWLKKHAGWSKHMELEPARNRGPAVENIIWELAVYQPPRRPEDGGPGGGGKEIKELDDPWMPVDED